MAGGRTVRHDRAQRRCFERIVRLRADKKRFGKFCERRLARLRRNAPKKADGWKNTYGLGQQQYINAL